MSSVASHVVKVDAWWSPASVAPPEAVELLTSDEATQLDRFHFEHHRQSYLAAHAMLRLALRLHGGRELAGAPLLRGAFGKPYLDGGPEISLSHTRGMVACAIAQEGPIGIDVENVNRTNPWRRLLARVLSAAEISAIEAMPASRQQRGFYECWTLKEAWTKATGLGLQGDFRTLSTIEPAAGVVLSLHEITPDVLVAIAVLSDRAEIHLRPFDWQRG